MNSEDGPNFAQTKSIVDHKSVFIDRYQDLTFDTDYAYNIDRKHLVPDREFGLSVLAVPFYIAGKWLAPYSQLPYLGGYKNITPATVVQVWTYVSIPFYVALTLAFVFEYLRYRGYRLQSILLFFLALGFGTLLWKYSTYFIRQPVTSVSILASFVLTLDYLINRSRPHTFLIVGFFLGVAAITDYFTWITAALIIALLIYCRSFRSLAFLSVTFLPFLLSALVYNQLIFGSLITSPHSHEGRAEYRYMSTFTNNFKTNLIYGSYTNLFQFGPISPTTISWVLGHPDITATIGARWATIWGYKGIFVQTPLLFVALFGWWQFVRQHLQHRLMLCFIGCLILLNFVPMAMFTQFWSPGLYDTRHFLNVVPIVLFGIVFLGQRSKFTKSYLFKCFTYITLTISLFFGFESMITGWGPYVSGETRYSLKYFFNPTLTQSSLIGGLLNSFPNVYNWYLLVPVALILYLLFVRGFIFVSSKILKSNS
jgi:hypothetical protein